MPLLFTSLYSSGAAAGGGGAFEPPSAGLELHFDASEITGLSDDDPVGTWSDLSGNSRDLGASGSDRPTYKTGIQNGLPVVRVTAAQFMQTSATWSDFTQPNTVIVVARRSSTSGRNKIIDTDTVTTGRMACRFNFPENQYSLNVGSTISGGTSDITDFHTVLYHANSTSSEIIVDGTTVVTDDSGTRGIDDPVLVAASSFDHPDESFAGDIAEILIYSRSLTSQEKTDIFDGLATKWGLS